MYCCVFFFQAEDGIRDAQESRGLGDVYKRQEYGGALLVGLNGISVVAHGRSNAKAMKNAIRFAALIARSGFVTNARNYFERT